jgi:hypothetical protein
MRDTRFFLLASSSLLPLTCVGQSHTADNDGSADFSRYMLAPGISDNTTVHGINPDLNVSFGDIWRNLQFGGMARPTVHHGLPLKGNWDIGWFGSGSSFSGQIEAMPDWRIGDKISPQFGCWWLYSGHATGTGTHVFRHDLLTQGLQLGATFTSDARLRPNAGYKDVQHSGKLLERRIE